MAESMKKKTTLPATAVKLDANRAADKGKQKTQKAASNDPGTFETKTLLDALDEVDKQTLTNVIRTPEYLTEGEPLEEIVILNPRWTVQHFNPPNSPNTSPQPVAVLCYYYPYWSHREKFKEDDFSKNILCVLKGPPVPPEDPADEWKYQKDVKQYDLGVPRLRNHLRSLLASVATHLREVSIANEPNVLVTIVPGHDPEKSPNETGLAMLLKRCLVSSDVLEDGIGYVRRQTKIGKSVENNSNRDVKKQESSMHIVGNVHNRIVLLLDDVITTGASMQAARNLLERAGAHRVLCFAVGKTYSG